MELQLEGELQSEMEVMRSKVAQAEARACAAEQATQEAAAVSARQTHINNPIHSGLIHQPHLVYIRRPMYSVLRTSNGSIF
jgi:hypothetical protein